MIISVQEVQQIKQIVDEVTLELSQQGIAFKKVEQGIMIETPAAAMISDLLAKEVDFFSIGTNDLCQYALAVDRMNQEVSYLYDTFNPGILRLIKLVTKVTAPQTGLFTGMCGEMAGDPAATILLLGLGLDEFSMSAFSIPQIKKIIRSVRYEDAKVIAETAMNLETGEEVLDYMLAEMKKLNIDIK